METFISNSKLKKINEQFIKDTRKFNIILSLFIIVSLTLISLIFLFALHFDLEDLAIITFVVLIFYLIFGLVGIVYFKQHFKSRFMLDEYALELLALNGKTLTYIDKTLRRTLVRESIFIEKHDTLTVNKAYSFDIDGVSGKFFEVYASRSSGKSSYPVLEGILITLDKCSEERYNSFLKYNNYSKKGYYPHKVKDHKKLYLFTPKNEDPVSIKDYAKVYQKLLDLNICDNAGLYISTTKTELIIKTKIKPIKIKKIDEDTLKQTISYYETFYNIIKKNINFINKLLDDSNVW